jgi:type II secretory ATPase GspE/PulE/Tfp pilus assembly ATPase PilB-like protein
MNTEIKEIIQRNPTTERIRKLAIKNGMIELSEVGKKKVLEGITSVFELLTIISENE